MAALVLLTGTYRLVQRGFLRHDSMVTAACRRLASGSDNSPFSEIETGDRARDDGDCTSRPPAELPPAASEWMSALKRAVELESASDVAANAAVSNFEVLLQAVAEHQVLLRENGIGVEVDQRERIRVNARRVGLEAPEYLDQLPGGSSDP